jgi:hypothetical protein
MSTSVGFLGFSGTCGHVPRTNASMGVVAGLERRGRTFDPAMEAFALSEEAALVTTFMAIAVFRQFRERESGMAFCEVNAV